MIKSSALIISLLKRKNHTKDKLSQKNACQLNK